MLKIWLALYTGPSDRTTKADAFSKSLLNEQIDTQPVAAANRLAKREATLQQKQQLNCNGENDQWEPLKRTIPLANFNVRGW